MLIDRGGVPHSVPVFRLAGLRKHGRTVMVLSTASCKSTSLRSVSPPMPFMLMGSHVSRNDALCHRFGVGE